MSRGEYQTVALGNADSVNGRGPCASGLPAASDNCSAASRAYGIVLAGVHAWGGCRLDEVSPRTLAPVAGRPLICHVLAWLRDQGIGSVSLCANSDTRGIRRYLGDGRGQGLSLEYYEDVMPRGPAGCVRDAGLDCSADWLVVVHGTIVPEVDLSDLLVRHAASGASLTIVSLGGHSGNGHGNGLLQPAGMYIFSREALGYVPEAGYQDIKEGLVPRLEAAGKLVATLVVDGNKVGQVKDTQSYMAVNRWVVDRICGRAGVPTGYVRIGEALVHESARLSASARLIGPMIVDADCLIDGDAVIVGPSAIGRGCVIGSGSLVSRSVLWAGCAVGQGATVDHGVLTEGSQVAPGAEIRRTVHVPPRRLRSALAVGSRLAKELLKRESLAPVDRPVIEREPETGRGRAAPGGLSPAVGAHLRQRREMARAGKGDRAW